LNLVIALKDGKIDQLVWKNNCSKDCLIVDCKETDVIHLGKEYDE